MKKATKKKKGLFDQKLVFIVDKRLNNVETEDFVLEKLAQANESLRKIKSFPK